MSNVTNSKAELKSLEFDNLGCLVVSGEPDFLEALCGAPYIMLMLSAALRRGGCACSPVMDITTDNGQPVLEIYCTGSELSESARREISEWFANAETWYHENFSSRETTFGLSRSVVTLAGAADQLAKVKEAGANVGRDLRQQLREL